MTYSAEISRANPSCMIFVIDQSGSMADPVAGDESGRSKSETVATAVNRLIQNLVIKCQGPTGPRDYYFIAAIGYGGRVGSAFSGALGGRELLGLKDIAESPLRMDEKTRKVADGAGGLVDQPIRLPIWLEPVADNGTPMREAMTEAHRIAAGWVAEHPSSFPPTVFHFTDGESTDGDPSDEMRGISSLAMDDGSPLIYNVHVSSNANAKSMQFPSSSDSLPDQYSKMLFGVSSELTPFARQVAERDHGFNVAEGARGFVLNADATLLVQALDIGTRPANLR